jgi:hypothetical protein
MHALRAWGDMWAVGEPPLRAEHHGHPIQPYVACATCGEPVRTDDLELISTVPDWDITGPKRSAQAPSDEPSATIPHRHSNLDERSPIPGRSESKPGAGS